MERKRRIWQVESSRCEWATGDRRRRRAMTNRGKVVHKRQEATHVSWLLGVLSHSLRVLLARSCILRRFISLRSPKTTNERARSHLYLRLRLKKWKKEAARRN